MQMKELLPLLNLKKLLLKCYENVSMFGAAVSQWGLTDMVFVWLYTPP